MVLNRREREILITKARKWTIEKSLAYLKEEGFEMVSSTYYKILGEMSTKTKERLLEICKKMEERHMERIEELGSIKDLLWKTLNDPKITNTERIRVLKELREIQPYISAYDESTQGVIEGVIQNFGKEDQLNQVPSLSSLDSRRTEKDITTKTS